MGQFIFIDVKSKFQTPHQEKLTGSVIYQLFLIILEHCHVSLNSYVSQVRIVSDKHPLQLNKSCICFLSYSYRQKTA